MKKEGVVINEKDHPEIYKWMLKNISDYRYNQKHFTLTSDNKINAYCNVAFCRNVSELIHPFGCVEGYFTCNFSTNLTSLIAFPERVSGWFGLHNCNNVKSFIGFPKHVEESIFFDDNFFSNNPDCKERYSLYVDMWIKLLENLSENEKWEYINNYKDKVDGDNICPIIPKEIINKYKIDFLLNEK